MTVETDYRAEWWKEFQARADYQLRLDAAERTLREIGNLIGGPTMTYSGIHEIREWRARAQKIAALVSGALTDEDQHSGEAK